jgi:23S rRNA pseudouridine2605 synthase
MAMPLMLPRRWMWQGPWPEPNGHLAQTTYVHGPEVTSGPCCISRGCCALCAGPPCYNGEMNQPRFTDAQPERLQKVLARAGVGSRRSVEALIREGRVTVNHRPATLGQKVGPRDEIRVYGRRVTARPEGRAYYVLHKPVGYITSVRDEHGRRTVLDLARVPERVYPVGRLDSDSEGLVLLTNDGELAHRLTHPRYSVPKVYHVRVKGEVSQATLARLRRGVVLEDGPAKVQKAEILQAGEDATVLRLTLTEGRKREIRRMMEAVGHPVERLQRVSIGPLQLGDLAPGRWRRLSVNEARALRRQAGLDRGRAHA